MLLNFSPLGRPWRTVYFFQRPVPSPLALNSLCWVQPYWPRRFGNGKHLKVRWRSWLDCKKHIAIIGIDSSLSKTKKNSKLKFYSGNIYSTLLWTNTSGKLVGKMVLHPRDVIFDGHVRFLHGTLIRWNIWVALRGKPNYIYSINPSVTS